ncbi:hypothetical protein [Micromonospora sp. NPDC049107]|uniref:hypothetical protein n=1 Tax=Micromonospora sp. NPDC049107 TaxID=3154349 RepID=UPI0033EF042F
MCFPESSSVSMHGVTTTAPTVHRIGRTGGIMLYGHGRGVPEGALQPAAPGTDAAPAWEGGDSVTVAGMSIPDRHVHPDTRADLERLSALAARSGELDRAARDAKRDTESAGTDARRLAADAAAAGTRSMPLPSP